MAQKLTTNQLYAMRDEINSEGALKADVYFADEKGMMGKPVAYARDVHGVERVLVVWVDGWITNPENYPDTENLLGESVLSKLSGKALD